MSTTSSPISIFQFPCLNDNYGYLIHDATSGNTAAIDTPCAATYSKVLKNKGWKLTHILNTHHHWDHVGGNEALLEEFPSAEIHGPATEVIPKCTHKVDGGDTIGGFFQQDNDIQVLSVGGHTKGHIAYYMPSIHALFCGDALFALGCGKMFEGTPSQFWKSLETIRDLPDDTLVYCAHEYTMSNAKFAVSVDPTNAKLQERYQQIQQMRQQDQPTVPSLLGLEKQTNPFLRVDCSDEIRNNVGAVGTDPPDVVFGKVRRAKDVFRG